MKTAKICLLLDKMPPDFEPLDSEINLHGEDGATAITANDIFLFFANLSCDDYNRRLIIDILSSVFSDTDITEEKVAAFKNKALSFFPEFFIDFLITSICALAEDDIKDVTDLPEVVVAMPCKIANRMAETLCEPDKEIDTDRTNKSTLVSLLCAFSHFDLGLDLSYQPVLGTCNGNFTFLNAISFKDALSTINFAVLTILKDSTIIRKCKNCGAFFVPSVRSDELYCNRKLANGKTCKSIGYDSKIKKDNILSTYRKIYKTQNARKQRNLHRPNIEGKFLTWKLFAKKELKKCQDGEITLEEMISAISSDEWIKA